MTAYSPMPIAGKEINTRDDGGSVTKARFDAYLYQPVDKGDGPLKLVIKLRINLWPLPAAPFPMALDADKRPFWTLPWQPADWQLFVRLAALQANMWNNKFWLVPSDFARAGTENCVSWLDRKFDTFPNQAARPNIRCELNVDFAAKDDPHRSIKVVNIDLSKLQGQTLNPGTFRSESLVYDSLDGLPWFFPYGQGPGQPMTHWVIAHEIGHAMGLGHIGTLLRTPLCQVAMFMKEHGTDGVDPNTQGGKNSFYCYGRNQGIAVVGNIMGAGDAFTIENAKPWLRALDAMSSYQYELLQWRVVTQDPGPHSWVR